MLGALVTAAASPAVGDAPARSPRPLPRPGAAMPAATQKVAAVAAAASPEALVDAARLGGRVSYAVLDARTGALLAGRDPSVGQPPASVAKAMTALFALEALGAGHRFVTRLIATGPISNGRLTGDLVLVGAGDPTLTTDALGDLAARMRAAGLREVTGRFLVHAGYLPHIAQISGDQPEHVGYNPAISGLNLNFNRVHFEWRRGKSGWQTAMDARAERFVPQVRMAKVRIVERETPLFTYARQDRVESWTVASAALGKGGSRWLPVRQPEVYAAEVFQTLAAAQGVRLADPQSVGGQPGGTLIAQVASEPLTDVLRDMLRHSTNLTAEVVGLAASGAGNLAGSAGRMSDWLAARFGVKARFVDHSGLGGASRISAADMATVFQRARETGALRAILREFPIGEGKGKPQPAQVLAKTGTLNFVSGLAGYVSPPGGRELAFAIFAADTARRDGLSQRERENPAGGPEWTRRARKMQRDLLAHWAAVYG